MQVILTPTAVADMFGPGLNGFQDSVPGPPTELSAEWFNSVQMEVVNLILGQGIVLDGLQFDQLKEAVDNYSFIDPSLTGFMTVAGTGGIDFLSGAALYMEVGSTFYCFTDDAQFFGDLVIGDDASDVLAVVNTTSFYAPVFLTEDVEIGTSAADQLVVDSTTTFNADVDFGSNTITGLGGTVSTSNVSATNVTVEELRFQNSVTTLPSVAGRSRWNNTFFSFCDATNTVRTFDEPVRGYDATLATPANPLTDTTASATRRVKHNEPVWIEMGSHVETDTGGSNANYQLKITGPLGVATPMTSAIIMATASKGYKWHEYILWTPTDDFPAETAEQNYSFLVRMGTSAGNLTAARIGIKVSSAIQA